MRKPMGLLGALIDAEGSDESKNEHPAFDGNAEGRVSLMAGLASAYKTAPDYNVGDFVVWKDGLKNLRFPEYGEPVIVMSILAGARPEFEDGKGHSIGHETVTVGLIDPGGQFSLYWVDGARFRKR